MCVGCMAMFLANSLLFAVHHLIRLFNDFIFFVKQTRAFAYRWLEIVVVVDVLRQSRVLKYLGYRTCPLRDPTVTPTSMTATIH